MNSLIMALVNLIKIVSKLIKYIVMCPNYNPDFLREFVELYLKIIFT
jgi:hypothetical protein